MADDIYVDNTLHTAANATGTCPGVGGANFIYLALPGGVDDQFNEYGIRIVSGTGAGQQRQITDYAASVPTAWVDAWVTIPDATSTYEITRGCDLNTGLEFDISDQGPLLTLGAIGLAGKLLAGATGWVRKARSYTLQDGATGAVMNVTTFGSATAPVVISGFKDVAGDAAGKWGDDAYRPLINATGLTYGITLNGPPATAWLVIEHVRVTGASSHGINANSARVLLRDCDEYLCGGSGAFLGASCSVEGGAAYQNTSYGVIATGDAGIYHTSAHDNVGARQISVAASSVVFAPIVYGLPNDGTGIYAASSGVLTVIGATIDGGTATGTVGIRNGGAGGVRTINCAIHRCVTDILSGTNHLKCETALHNMISPTPAAYSGYAASLGEVATDVPAYYDVGTRDYRLRRCSPGRVAGFPAYHDIGAHQMRNAGCVFAPRLIEG